MPAGMNMDKIYKTAAKAVLVLLVLWGITCSAAAQSYAGGSTWTSSGGSSGQYAGGSVSTGDGGTRTFSVGSGFMYSMNSVSPDEVSKLQDEGVRVINIPAGTTVYVTASTGQPLNINTQQGATPNMIVFGPNGFQGVGVWAGPGTGAWAGTGRTGTGAGAGASAGAGGISVGTGGIGAGAGASAGGSGISVGTGGIGAGAGASTGGGGISVGTGGSGSMQMYSFTGNSGQAFLITQQAGGTMDKVLVVFQ